MSVGGASGLVEKNPAWLRRLEITTKWIGRMITASQMNPASPASTLGGRRGPRRAGRTCRGCSPAVIVTVI